MPVVQEAVEHADAEELLEIIMRRYERASTMLTSNRAVEGWGKLLGDAVLPGVRRTGPSRRTVAGAAEKASAVPRRAEDPRQLRLQL